MHIAFFNPQGNFHAEDLYLTEHPDFGGQLVYVKEVAQSLARQGLKVDIITRRIKDPKMPGFEADLDTYPGVEGLRILRIPFGGDSFRPKEELWPYLQEYVEGILTLYSKERESPQVVTGHYGDGGLAAALFFQRTGIPYSFTLHSPGALKLEKLGVCKKTLLALNEEYNFHYRLYGEGKAMEHSCINIVSTKQERYEQYAHRAYRDFIDTEDDSRFAVISPGVNTRIFYPKEEEGEGFIPYLTRDLDPSRLQLPGIIASSRLEKKKNHLGLVEAFALSSGLQERANLLIALRGIDDPWQGGEGAEGEILDEILALIKEHSLEGRVAFLHIEDQKELASCYRYLCRNKGVFALTAHHEPFGLAPLEAAACGLPVVVTKNGGPSESLKDGDREYGVLVDPSSPVDIARGLLRVLGDLGGWYSFHYKGLERVREEYTWEQTAAAYLQALEGCGKIEPDSFSLPWPASLSIEKIFKVFT